MAIHCSPVHCRTLASILLHTQTAASYVHFPELKSCLIFMCCCNSFVSRPLPTFQCCTLKNGRAWFMKSRARDLCGRVVEDDHFARVLPLLAHSDTWFSKLARGSQHDENASKPRWKDKRIALCYRIWQVRSLQTVQT